MYWAEFATIVIAHLLAVASPGPDFAVVMRQSVNNGTVAGLWTSLGVGIGILVHVAYCLLGVALILSQSPALFNTTRIIAALYLFYLGVLSLRAGIAHKDSPPQADGVLYTSPRKLFVLGFLTNGLNPKATLFFLALFTVVISADTPVAIQVLYGAYLSLATIAWFAMLSLVLGREKVREFVLRAGRWFELAMAVVLIFLAVQIAFASF